MRKLNLSKITIAILVLFISGLGIRRLVLRNQIEKLGQSIEEMREKDLLQDNLNDLMASFMKSDADLRGYVISQNPEFLDGFEARIDSLHASFSVFMEMAVDQNVLSDIDTLQIDSMVIQRKLYQENLNKQYESLKQYAFINSHEVRAHVATMLGLMNLSNAKYLSEDEREKIISHLYDETTKLDKVIRRLSKLITN